MPPALCLVLGTITLPLRRGLLFKLCDLCRDSALLMLSSQSLIVFFNEIRLILYAALPSQEARLWGGLNALASRIVVFAFMKRNHKNTPNT